MTELFDIAIIGGGCAGSTAATLLAKKGFNVLIVEQDKLPRYHIGESLVPGVIPILEEIGLTEAMTDHNFTVKNGVSFVWGAERKTWTVRFEEDSPIDHAFQVVRSEFDYMLLNHARSSGVRVLEEARVVDVLFENDRCCGLKYILGNSGSEVTVRARFIIDASGQNAVLSRKSGWLEWDEDLKNVAIWAYYQGGNTFEGKDAGNILIENTPNGWIWVIPLHEGTQSVGLVMPTVNVTGGGRQNLEQIYLDTLANSGETKRLLAPAQRTSNFHTARDWSYKSQHFHGPGFLLVGDAAGFVDPLFSSGVFLAMNGARIASIIIESILHEPEKENELLDRYEKAYTDFFDKVVSMVHYFYQASEDKESYWVKAQELIDPFQKLIARQDFVRLISGMAGLLPF